MMDDSSIAVLRSLIAAGESGETAVQNCFADAVGALGGLVEHHAYRPCDIPVIDEFTSGLLLPTEERVSVLGRFPGTGGGRSLILFAHPDSEPATDTDRWSKAPFAGLISEGRIYGWGVADDRAGVAIMVDAMATLHRRGIMLAGDVILASTPSKRQARGVSALLHSGLTADAALYLHPAESGAGTGEIKAVTCGQLTFRLRIEGKAPPTTEPLQTGFAHLAINPITKAQSLMSALAAFDEERSSRVFHPLIHQAVGRSTNLMISSISSGDTDLSARMSLTCEIGAAISFPPGEGLNDIKTAVEAALAKAVADDPWLTLHPPLLAWDTGTAAAEVRLDHPFFVTAKEAVRAATGTEPVCNPMHTGSDIRNPIVQKGIPTLGLGPLCGNLSQNGQHDEWVDLADYRNAVLATADIIQKWCTPSHGRQ
ncbi:MAG: hypothetical protein CFE31_08860 [Rhizobiales bacterium PAR1]|nr:MAG: hypothetical protein CFE31_08860 [Rhizobiales bacterium PAR1]